MAFSAGAAQAEAGAQWLILTSGGLTKTGQELSAGVLSTLENNDASLLTKIVGIKTRFLCTAGTLVGVKLESEGRITNGGKANFTGCVTYLNEELAPECTPKSPGAALETIETNATKGEIVLHEPSAGVREGVNKIEPKEGDTFVTLEAGVGCPIGNKIPLIGKFFLNGLPLGSSRWSVVGRYARVARKSASELEGYCPPARSNVANSHNLSERRHGDRLGAGILGTCAVILSLTTFAASSSAEEIPKWLLLSLKAAEGTVTKTGEELPAEVQGQLENEDASILSKLVGIKAKFLCTTATLIGVTRRRRQADQRWQGQVHRLQNVPQRRRGIGMRNAFLGPASRND
jgi:hypothetical protein